MASLLGGVTGSGGREFVLKILADVKDATRGVEQVEKATSSFRDKAVGWGKTIATGLAVTAVAEFGRQTVESAMAADDALDGMMATFGRAGDEVVAFSEKAADRMGLSEAAYQTMATRAGGMLKELGVPTEELAGQTDTLIQRAADLAVTYGVDTATAVDDMTKAMAGQTKGLRKYNVVIDKTQVEARALALGYVDASGAVTEAGKAIATQQLIMEHSADSMGMYAKNAGDFGSQQEIMAAKMENLKATIGESLLPILSQLMEMFAPILEFMAANSSWLVPLAGIIMGIVVAIKAWTIAQAAWNLVMLANPIGLIVAGVVALVAAIVIAYQKVDWFRDLVDEVFRWIRDNWPLLLAILTGPFGGAVAIIIKNWDTIVSFAKQVPERIRQALAVVFDVITSPFKKAWEEIRHIPGLIAEKFTWLVDRIKGMFNGFSDAIVGPFRTAFNAIKWLWNHTVGGFHMSIPSWVPILGGKSWTIPEMATGGIVTRPTIALIGEAGPEAVIPLSQMSSMSTAAAPVIINVYALNATAETGRMIAESLREYNRTAGGVA
jgi:hypothetical protein